MKNLRQLVFIILALGVVGSCTKLKESPEPSTPDTSGGTGGGGGGGGQQGNPAVYVGLWKMTEKTLNGNSIFAGVDSIPEIHLQAAATATWNYYVNGNLAHTESDIYNLITSSSPPVIIFNKKGARAIVNKTGSSMSWQFQDPKTGNQEVIETYTKQ